MYMVEAVGYRVEDNSDIEDSIINAAKKHYKDGRYDDAIRLYLGLLKTGASSKLYLDVGLCYYKKEEFDKAIEYLTHATTLDIKNSAAFSYIGNCYFRKLDAQRAIENWTIARSLTPKDEFVCLNLAIAYFAKNMSYESIFYYDKYLKYTNNKDTKQYQSIYKNISELRESAENYFLNAQNSKGVAAEENYIKAVKKYPIIAEYSLALGNLYYNTKNYLKALQYYELVLRDNTVQNKEIYKRIAQSFHILNDYRQSYCFYNRYLRFTISSQEEYLEVNKVIHSLKSMLDESSYDITIAVAKQHYEYNRYFEALIEYENAVILRPDKKEELEYNIKRLRSFVESEKIMTKKYIEKGKDLLKKGEREHANKYFTQVIQISNPKSEEYKLAAKYVNV